MRTITVSVTTQFDISVDEGISLDEVQAFALQTLAQDIMAWRVEGIEVDMFEEVQ